MSALDNLHTWAASILAPDPADASSGDSGGSTLDQLHNWAASILAPQAPSTEPSQASTQQMLVGGQTTLTPSVSLDIGSSSSYTPTMAQLQEPVFESSNLVAASSTVVAAPPISQPAASLPTQHLGPPPTGGFYSSSHPASTVAGAAVVDAELPVNQSVKRIPSPLAVQAVPVPGADAQPPVAAPGSDGVPPLSPTGQPSAFSEIRLDTSNEQLLPADPAGVVAPAMVQ